MAVRALSQLLEKDPDQSVRILMAEALNHCGTGGAIRRWLLRRWKTKARKCGSRAWTIFVMETILR